jgi:hypothetical protein
MYFWDILLNINYIEYFILTFSHRAYILKLTLDS